MAHCVGGKLLLSDLLCVVLHKDDVRLPQRNICIINGFCESVKLETYLKVDKFCYCTFIDVRKCWFLQKSFRHDSYWFMNSMGKFGKQVCISVIGGCKVSIFYRMNHGTMQVLLEMTCTPTSTINTRV